MTEVCAFVPGHITGFFSAHPADDPAVAGSRGAGVTLSDGVTVCVRRGEAGVTFEGADLSIEPVETVLSALGVADEARVVAESELPLGAGFGISGALALGTALAANAVFDCSRSENELVTLAHEAEVTAGTGLGDVVAQARGGLPVRLDPGAPGHGRLDGVPARPRVEYLSLGELSTEDILAGDTTQLTAAGEAALDALIEDPTLSTFMAASRRFAREATLLTADVEDILAAVSETGGDAAMAMLGETVFALGTGLSDAGYDADACRVHAAGATVLGDAGERAE